MISVIHVQTGEVISCHTVPHFLHCEMNKAIKIALLVLSIFYLCTNVIMERCEFFGQQAAK